MKYFFVTCLLILFSCLAQAQDSCTIVGYVYEQDNKGYLNEVVIKAALATHPTTYQATTNLAGQFEIRVPVLDEPYTFTMQKTAFVVQKKLVKTVPNTPDKPMYLSIELERQPGYILDLSLIELANSVSADSGVYSIDDVRIEVYNNTLQQSVLDIAKHPYPSIQIPLEQGYEYIFMLRKKGYYTKELRANINVNGCILCMEGFGSVVPNVVDNLTEENAKGILSSSVTLKKVVFGEKMKLDKIYYDLGKSTLRPEAKAELNTLVQLMNNNPNLVVELSSHTDARGNNTSNLQLSQARANSVLQYISQRVKLKENQVTAKGYGELQPVNSCVDGVACSEEQHQQNRRTELLVIDVLIDSKNTERSLATIMQEKNFDKILAANTQSYAEIKLSLRCKNGLGFQQLPANYTGYKIELLTSTQPIDCSHYALKKVPNLQADLAGSAGLSLLVATDFSTLIAAQQAVPTYQKDFTSLRLVQYIGGKRQK